MVSDLQTLKPVTVLLITALAGCSDNSVRNIDYFTIGDFDTRDGLDGIQAKLASSEVTLDSLNSEWSMIVGKDNSGNEVQATIFKGDVVKFSIDLDFAIKSQHAIELSSLENRYGFDKIRRDDLGECTASPCVISEYNCDKKIMGDDKCSIHVLSSNWGKGWFTKIKWANISVYKQITEEYLRNISKNLPN